MFGVRKSTERKFWQGLVKGFQRAINRAKGAGSSGDLISWLRSFLPSQREDKLLRHVVSTMVKTEQKETANSWKEAAARAGRGPELFREISKEMQGPVGNRVAEIIAQNAKLIQTIPQEWADYVVQYVQRESMKGRRPEDIENELRKILPERMQKNLKVIARTECAKANAALVQARAEHLKIRAYIWRSAKDERTRDAHRAMEGILVFYNDPPNPEALFGGKPYGNYHAGNTFNCRCYQEPVVSIDMLPDVVRVHDHGSILELTKRQIRQRYGKIA